MGRQGVSKRKSKQPNSKPFVGAVNTPFVERVTEGQPIRTHDIGKMIANHKSADIPAVGGKNHVKKG